MTSLQSTYLELVINNVSVIYNNGHVALKNATTTLQAGSIYALVGVNGSGKSTLFKAIMGTVRPLHGDISINQQSVKKAIKANLIAYVPQTEEIDWNFPVLVSDVVMMGRYGRMNFMRIPTHQDKEKVQQALEKVDMLHFADRQIGELSGGQKKRVFLARALAQEGKILLLDEPFTGVDVNTENAIIELLIELRDSGHIIMVSTHNLGSVPEFCDQVILLNKTIIAAGSTKTTFTHHNLEKTFGGVLKHIQISDSQLHLDKDNRSVTILTDDERPAVFYGQGKHVPPTRTSKRNKGKTDEQ